MNLTTLKSPILTLTPNSVSIPPSSIKIPSKRHRFNNSKSPNSLECICQSPKPPFSIDTTNTVHNKLQRLVLEFRSLPEPIDRVKRLLHHATTLPHFSETARSESNRVRGCTTQVWLEASLDDEYGRMRFRADSDSEITKGFVSCLVWLLDEAEPGEVLSIAADDLRGMNVGVHGNEMSRVNTWHNVLYAMQARTRLLVDEKEKLTPLEPPSTADLVGGGGGDSIRIQHLRC